MTQLILAISLRRYLPLIQKDFITHMHGPAVYEKEGLPFAGALSLENSADYYLFLTDFTLLSVLHPFPLLIAFFVIMQGF